MKMTVDVDRIQVASPCTARWNDMTGDERTRFCGQCQKHVYNLSAMTRTQIGTLIREKEGKICGRFYRRADGRVLTADCPSRLRRMRERLASVGGALCALLFSLAGCSPRQTDASRGKTGGEILLGDVAIPPAVSAKNHLPMMGLVAVPAPAVTNPPVLMGQVHVQKPQAPAN